MIYNRKNQTDKYEKHFGGSLISSNIVISSKYYKHNLQNDSFFYARLIFCVNIYIFKMFMVFHFKSKIIFSPHFYK